MLESKKIYEESLRNMAKHPRCVVVFKHILYRMGLTGSGDGSTPELRTQMCALREEAIRILRDIQRVNPVVANDILVRTFENGRNQ